MPQFTSFEARLCYKVEKGNENEILDTFAEILQRETGLHVHIEPVHPVDDEA